MKNVSQENDNNCVFMFSLGYFPNVFMLVFIMELLKILATLIALTRQGKFIYIAPFWHKFIDSAFQRQGNALKMKNEETI